MDAIQNTTPETRADTMTMRELLSRLDALHAEQGRLEQTISQIKAAPDSENPSKLRAMVEVCGIRDRMAQRELTFLQHIYDDRFSPCAKTARAQEREHAIDALVKAAAECASPDVAGQMLKLVSDLMNKA